MSRRQRNYVPHLAAEWQRLFPYRPEKRDFQDEVICAVNFLMRQIDPAGTKPVIEPAMPAHGYESQTRVRSKGHAEVDE